MKTIFLIICLSLSQSIYSQIDTLTGKFKVISIDENVILGHFYYIILEGNHKKFKILIDTNNSCSNPIILLKQKSEWHLTIMPYSQIPFANNEILHGLKLISRGEGEILIVQEKNYSKYKLIAKKIRLDEGECFYFSPSFCTNGRKIFVHSNQ